MIDDLGDLVTYYEHVLYESLNMKSIFLIFTVQKHPKEPTDLDCFQAQTNKSES